MSEQPYRMSRQVARGILAECFMLAVVVVISPTGCSRGPTQGDAPPMAAVGPQQATKANPTDDDMRRAVKAFDEGDLDLAATCLERCLSRHPRNGDAMLLRAQIHNNKQEYEAATKAATEAIYLDPDDARGYAVRATAKAGLHQSTEALDDLSRAVKVSKNPAEIFTLRSQALFSLNQNDDAVTDASRAIEADPAYLPARLARILATHEMARHVLIDDIHPNAVDKRAMEQNRQIISDCDEILAADPRGDRVRAIALEHKVKSLLALYDRDAAGLAADQCRALGATLAAGCNKAINKYDGERRRK